VVESSGREASSNTAKSVNWYDMTLMDEKSRISNQSVAEASSISEGAATAATDLMGSEIDPGGDTSLTKREG
jgi:uncharacterized protein YgiM (DUF1202 family)